MANRTIRTSKLVKRFIKELNRNLSVNKIILFGSRVKGAVKKWSDIDLAVISDDFKKMDYLERLTLLGKLAWQAKTTVIEALGFTTLEYKNASKLDFLGEIKKTGKIIYG